MKSVIPIVALPGDAPLLNAIRWQGPAVPSTVTRYTSHACLSETRRSRRHEDTQVPAGALVFDLSGHPGRRRRPSDRRGFGGHSAFVAFVSFVFESFLSIRTLATLRERRVDRACNVPCHRDSQLA